MGMLLRLLVSQILPAECQPLSTKSSATLRPNGVTPQFPEVGIATVSPAKSLLVFH